MDSMFLLYPSKRKVRLVLNKFIKLCLCKEVRPRGGLVTASIPLELSAFLFSTMSLKSMVFACMVWSGSISEEVLGAVFNPRSLAKEPADILKNCFSFKGLGIEGTFWEEWRFERGLEGIRGIQKCEISIA